MKPNMKIDIGISDPDRAAIAQALSNATNSSDDASRAIVAVKAFDGLWQQGVDRAYLSVEQVAANCARQAADEIVHEMAQDPIQQAVQRIVPDVAETQIRAEIKRLSSPD